MYPASLTLLQSPMNDLILVQLCKRLSVIVKFLELISNDCKLVQSWNIQYVVDNDLKSLRIVVKAVHPLNVP